MKLILIHGAPATGKLTVALALSEATKIPLLDNHATHDVARKVFGFGQPGFWDLVHDLRLAAFAAAARAKLPALIVTSAYSAPQDDPLVDDYDETVSERGGSLYPVFLHCNRETLMARVTAPDRVVRGKIATREVFEPYSRETTLSRFPAKIVSSTQRKRLVLPTLPRPLPAILG